MAGGGLKKLSWREKVFIPFERRDPCHKNSRLSNMNSKKTAQEHKSFGQTHMSTCRDASPWIPFNWRKCLVFFIRQWKKGEKIECHCWTWGVKTGHFSPHDNSISALLYCNLKGFSCKNDTKTMFLSHLRFAERKWLLDGLCISSSSKKSYSQGSTFHFISLKLSENIRESKGLFCLNPIMPIDSKIYLIKIGHFSNFTQ